MRALLYDEGGRVHLEEVPPPGELPAGFVRVRVVCTMISPGTETGNLLRLRSHPDPHPRREPFGYTASGVCLEVGEGIEHVRPGQRVACYGGPYTRHAAELAVPRHLVWPVPEVVGEEEASSVGLGAIALNAFRQADLHLGEVVVVQGLGVLGLLAAQMACAAGCEGVAVDILPGRLRIARRLLSSRWLVLDARCDPVDRAVSDLSEGIGADAVISTLPGSAVSPRTTHRAVSWLRLRGRLVIVGRACLDANHDLLRRKEIEPRYVIAAGPGRYDPSYERLGRDYPVGYVRWTEGRNLRAYLRLLQAGLVRVAPLITHTYPVERAAEAFEQIIREPDRTLGVVLRW